MRSRVHPLVAASTLIILTCATITLLGIKKGSTYSLLSIWISIFVSSPSFEKKRKNQHLSISNSKRRIYKIVKKKKRKEKNSKEAKNIYQKISKDCAIPTFLTSCRKTWKRGDDLFGSFFHRAYYFKPCVTRVVVGSLRRLVPAKCQSQETCQRRQMCRVSAASYRACASPRLASLVPCPSFGYFRGEIAE